MHHYDTAIKDVGGLVGDSFCSSNCKCQAPEGFTNLQSHKYRDSKEANLKSETGSKPLNIDNIKGAKAIHECKAYWDEQSSYT